MVRLAVKGRVQRRGEGEACKNLRHGEKRVARRRRLAAGAREKHALFLAFVGRGEWTAREWFVKLGCSCGREARSICVRSERRGADDWRAAVLRRAANGNRTGGSTAGGSAQRGAGVCDAGVCERHRSDWAGFARLVRKQLGGGHGFHGDARGRLAEWVCAKSDQPNSAAALPEFAGKTGAG